ncbi:uncharacterized protein [Arachis hypogaea]|uniref:uncharacterized protein n=1 Tax=Arachis hypogaea TaxID=3818 RepID=UPI0011057327|nr:uncharacterized protein LOC112785862 [Arachis hypogaea]
MARATPIINLLREWKRMTIKLPQLAQRLDVQECNLVIRERPANQPQYSLPTASQVAAIIVGDDIETMIRPNDHSTVLQAGRLLQQYVVDNYVKMETGKLRWVRQRQKELQAELYQGLQDYLHTGENNAENVGRRMILPSSFVSSRRDMTQRYEDGMAIVLKEGKPDIFLTMTCNPSWSEIALELSPTQTPQDRLDLTTRIFRAKFEQLKHDVITKGVLEKVKSYIYVTEFQKRGLPHVHMLLILENNGKLSDPDQYDSLVRAEIPCKETEPHLHEAVLRHMIHGPCRTLNQSSLCMKNEICSSIKSIKYLYKYCYKGPDRAAMEVHRSSNYDEVQQFINAGWIATPEACWRIFRFNLYRMYPSVERLQVHLPNQHQVSFYEHQTISKIVNNDYLSRTMLTELFALNQADDQQSRHLLYRKIPECYSWHIKEKEWRRRRSQKRSIGRIYTVSPTEGEKFYLRILLSNVRGPTGWDDLLTVDGVQYSSFKQSAQHRGLLESDSSIRSCLVEASILRMPCALRKLFATILIFCEPTDVRSLWDEFLSCMVDDYASTSTTTCNGLTNHLLRDLNDILLQHGKHIAQYDLSALTSDNDNDNFMPRIIQEEMSIEVPQEDLCSIERLNHDQSTAFRCIMNTVDQRESGVFFIDGPGGVGKTFLYRAIIADLRRKGHILLVTASSGIAATLLPGGRTSHSRFKIPINAEPSSTCNISKHLISQN